VLRYLREDAEEEREKRDEVKPLRGEVQVTSGSFTTVAAAFD
jgi:hypothetical protein